MVISPEFRMRQYEDDDHEEDAPHFGGKSVFLPGAKLAGNHRNIYNLYKEV